MRLFAGLTFSGLILSCLIGVFIGSGGYTIYYAEGASYLSNDSKSCVNCHIMRDHFDGWQKASHHAAATCNDCHLPQEFVPKYAAKVRNGFWHSKGFTLQDFHEPIRIRPANSRILQENCVRCHDTLVSEISGHSRSESDSLNCVRCHSNVGHGPTR